MTANKAHRGTRTPFEFGVLVVSVLATGAIIGTLVAHGIQNRPAQPDLRVHVAAAGDRNGGVSYVVTVQNNGGTTAEHVAVEVSVGTESREVELVAVARGDEERATVVFAPGTTGKPTARILSYTESSR